MTSRKSGKLEKAVVRIITGLLLLPLEALYFMLGVGIAHRNWLPQVPVIGYGNAVLLTILFDAALSLVVAQCVRRD